MKRKVTWWQSLVAILGVLLVIGGVYAAQWRKPEVQVCLVQPSNRAIVTRAGEQTKFERAELEAMAQEARTSQK